MFSVYGSSFFQTLNDMSARDKHFDVHLWRIRSVHFLSEDRKCGSYKRLFCTELHFCIFGKINVYNLYGLVVGQKGSEATSCRFEFQCCSCDCGNYNKNPPILEKKMHLRPRVFCDTPLYNLPNR